MPGYPRGLNGTTMSIKGKRPEDQGQKRGHKSRNVSGFQKAKGRGMDPLGEHQPVDSISISDLKNC